MCAEAARHIDGKKPQLRAHYDSDMPDQQPTKVRERWLRGQTFTQLTEDKLGSFFSI
jgi:hypothetical protein